MAFRDVKVTCIKAEGPCSRTTEGQIFYVKNACLEVPEGQRVCIYALGSLLATLAGAIIKSEKGEGILDLLDEWQCPDSKARVVFKIEAAP